MMLQIRPDGVVHFTPVRVVHIVPESLVHYAPVEVVHFTPVCSGSTSHVRLPHVRGGVSCGYFLGTEIILSSPCAWGCFYSTAEKFCHNSVFPMCVGVFLILGLPRLFG